MERYSLRTRRQIKRTWNKFSFAGNQKDDPTKCIVIVSADEGALDKFMEANAEMIAASGHVRESTVLKTYLS